jgi:hypothetical protein
MFYSEYSGVVPDIQIMAKGIAGKYSDTMRTAYADAACRWYALERYRGQARIHEEPKARKHGRNLLYVRLFISVPQETNEL